MDNTKTSSSRYRVLLDTSSTAIVVVNADWELIDFNNAWCRFLGYTAEELHGVSPRELTFREDLEKSETQIQELIAGKIERVQIEKRYIKKDGTVVWGDMSAQALPDTTGQITEIVATIVDITERKAKEDLLHEREQILKFHIENAPLAAISWDENFKCTGWNAAAEKIFGYAKKQAIGQCCLDLIVAESVRPLVSGIFNSLLTKTGGTKSINENITADGRIILCEWFNTPLRDKDGKIVGIASLAQDITQQKETEAALIKAENFTRQLLNTTLEGYWYIGPDGKTLDVNPALCLLLERQRDDIIGKSIYDFVDEENAKIFRSEIAQRQAGKNNTYEIAIQRPDGANIPCLNSATPIYDETGSPIGSVGLWTDISERKRAENSLRERDKIFHNFYQIVPDVFTVTKMDTGEFVDVNDGFCRITGYDRDDVIGERTVDLGIWKNDVDRERLVSGLKQDQMVNNLSADFGRKDGSAWPGIMSACVVQINGESHILASTKDVSDIRRSQQEAIKANQAKSEFLSSMSHELRTPMNAILGFTQLLDFNPREPLTKTQKSSVGLILKSGGHLLELIDRVLELSKIEAGKLSLNIDHVSARYVIDESLDLIRTRAETEGVRIIDQTVGKDIPLLWTDGTRLIQVLVNLLSNAVKYNREGGTVTLACREISGLLSRISVTDTGPGVPAEKQDGLFKPFERLGRETGQIEGTGIGLTITREIIELLGGRVDFKSEEGKGSSFWVDVPISDKQLAVQDGTEQTEKSSWPVKKVNDDGFVHTVLYVEDNPDNMRLMEMIIGQLGNTRLLTAYDAELGIDLAIKNKPDLILMDINLPGMSGVQALKKLQNTLETKDIPVIAITAAAMHKDVEAGLRAGFRDYITKPFNVPIFIKKISRTLQGIHNSV